ncbi:hypothetical protein NPIL_563241 [Nephila pilipes]|uniref:Uncharacterized protein n=1 Tax=Nephila pilipes TaxID=299642 RepID=A0A8X6MHJ0_NEPPI|nr:hypothetical protein NPIL_563241 [Nephila pilipes]
MVECFKTVVILSLQPGRERKSIKLQQVDEVVTAATDRAIANTQTNITTNRNLVFDNAEDIAQDPGISNFSNNITPIQELLSGDSIRFEFPLRFLARGGRRMAVADIMLRRSTLLCAL